MLTSHQVKDILGAANITLCHDAPVMAYDLDKVLKYFNWQEREMKILKDTCKKCKKELFVYENKTD